MSSPRLRSLLDDLLLSCFARIARLYYMILSLFAKGFRSLLALTNLYQTPIPSLPDDLLVSCFARVSSLHYPTLSLVSKSFRSLLASPELYHTRSSLGHIESCLYVCLLFTHKPNFRWFTLCKKPNQTLTNHTSENKKSSGYALVPISTSHYSQARCAGVVALGSSIYVIGGLINNMPSSSVSILDCQSHTWKRAPNMRLPRTSLQANVVDGKIYVTGGCKDCNESNYMEVFDPKTQIWEPVLCSLEAERCESWIYNSATIEGEIVMFGEKSVAYKPKGDRWEVIEDDNMNLGWSTMSSCTIDNVLYSYYMLTKIKWYDSKLRSWMDVMGLEGLSKFSCYDLVKLVDYGGKMVVLWDKYMPSSNNGNKETEIWCAVIALERRNNNHEIWGKIEWFDLVLTVPISCGLVCALAATV